MWNFYASVSVKKSEIVRYIPPMYLVRIRENPKKEQKYENWWNCKWLYLKSTIISLPKPITCTCILLKFNIPRFNKSCPF